MRDDEEAPLDTLHSVMDCNLTAPVMDCKATAVLGPASRTFYVSPTAVYLWVSDARHWRAGERGGAQSWLYRLPLDGIEKPSAIGAVGQPTDQFSFREDRQPRPRSTCSSAATAAAMRCGTMRIATAASLCCRSRSAGWATAAARVPLSRYRRLPPVGADAWNFQNRFVGNHILYGGHAYQRGAVSRPWSRRPCAAGRSRSSSFPTPSSGSTSWAQDGVVIGNDPRGSGSVFTAVDLRRPMARVGNSFTFPNAQQGENRSQAFFYRQDNADGSIGLLGLPITTQLQVAIRALPGQRIVDPVPEAARTAMFDLAGRLDADPYRAVDDACVASCVDWYGNARPIFIGNRVFALMGYELVEGRLARGAISEVARTNFAPPAEGAGAAVIPCQGEQHCYICIAGDEYAGGQAGQEH